MGSRPYPTSVRILVIVNCKQHHHAAVFPFGADAPFLKKPVREILRGIAFQSMDRYVRFAHFVFWSTSCAKAAIFCLEAAIHHPGKVVNVALRQSLLNLLGADLSGECKRNKQY